MKGLHHIVVETARLKYEFDIRRNITILQGDSATGKTTLVDLLRDYSRDHSGKSVRVQSDVPCFVYGGSEDLWLPVIQAVHSSILFIDEDYTFIQSREFAEAAAGSDNYYVLITRQSLPNLPYSIQEIYGIRTSGRYSYPEQIYHEFYPIYGENMPGDTSEAGHHIKPFLLTEDEKAGFQFFQSVRGQDRCVSAGGNSNVYRRLLDLRDQKELAVIADGAAFGAFIGSVVSFARAHGRVWLYFPESFEWLILKSGIVSTSETEQILAHPEDYIESREYFSWEQFFTALLRRLTAGDPLRLYQKNSLSRFYISAGSQEKILRTIPEDLRMLL